MKVAQSQSNLATLQAALKRRNRDAILITQPENRRYISGFTATDAAITESSGVLLVPAKDTPLLLTDSRYELQAKKEAAGFDVRLYPDGLMALLEKLLPRLGIGKLAFESHYLLHSTSVSLRKVADKVGSELLPVTNVMEKMRLSKTAPELAAIKKSNTLNEEVFKQVYDELRPGMTERQVALRIEWLMKEKGASRPSFETIVAAGPNGALPHAVPTDRQINTGEPIVIDMGAIVDGYCSDMTRTVVLGTPDDKTIKLFRLVRKAQLAGIAAIRAGVVAKDVDRAARSIIRDAGYGDNFGHGLGHGVGLAVHEAPSLNKKNRKELRCGMVVTVEPGVYLPDWGGIRLENMVLITEEGCEVLTRNTIFLDL